MTCYIVSWGGTLVFFTGKGPDVDRWSIERADAVIFYSADAAEAVLRDEIKAFASRVSRDAEIVETNSARAIALEGALKRDRPVDRSLRRRETPSRRR